MYSFQTKCIQIQLSRGISELKNRDPTAVLVYDKMNVIQNKRYIKLIMYICMEGYTGNIKYCQWCCLLHMNLKSWCWGYSRHQLFSISPKQLLNKVNSCF